MHPASRHHSREPRWRETRQIAHAQLTHMRHWLLDEGSLTRRLERAGGVFAVRRRLQQWQVPLASERRLLGMGQRQLAMVREVVLSVDGVPVVFARSVFPLTSLTGELRNLRKLKNRSLGAILFSRPDMRRSPFQIAAIDSQCGYVPRELLDGGQAWGRRSLFCVNSKRLLVSEVFLPRFAPWSRSAALPRSTRGRISTAIAPAKQ